MGRSSLGEFEQLVLLAVLRLDRNAYAPTIVEEIQDRAGRDASLASIYVVLGRLEDKGLLTSELGVGDAERGGRKKRYYHATEKAVESLRASRSALLNLWDGLTVITD